MTADDDQLLLLGPLRWRAAGVDRPWGDGRGALLLAWLAHQGDWVSRERAALMFWPDHSAEQARSNLRKTLHRLPALPPGAPPLQMQGEQLRWPVACDLRAFEAALAAQRPDRARALWRGEPWQQAPVDDLGELGPWLQAERQRLAALLQQPAPPEAARDGFTGRRAELAALARFAAGSERWMTLWGPGGIGKTELLRQALARHGGPTLFVRCADLPAESDAQDDNAAARLLARLGEALGEPALTPERLDDRLAGQHLLIGLDNLEGLRGAAARLAARLAPHAGVQVLASSRQRLGLAGEALLALQGLPWPGPEDAATAEGFDAVQLFLQAAAAHSPRAALLAQRDALVALCAAVEGWPLALTLTAAWTRHFGIRQVLDTLLTQAGQLRADDPTAPPRHAGLQACFAHSLALQAPAARDALAALSLLGEGFDAAAACATTEADLAVLGELIDAALVEADMHRPGQPRYRLHPLIRQFARQRLAADAAAEQAALDRLARHHLQRLAERPHAAAEHAEAAETFALAWHHACARAWGTELAAALPGLRALAHHRAAWAQATELVHAARPLWQGQPRLLALADALQAQADYAAGRFSAAASAAQALLPLWRRAGDAAALQQTLQLAGLASLHAGRYAAAERWLGQGLQAARGAGDMRGVATFVTALAQLDFHHGRFARCSERGREAVALLRARGGDAANVLGKLAMNLLADGRPDEALTALDEALADTPASRHLHRHVTLRLCRGLVLERAGQPGPAAAELATATAVQTPPWPPRLHYLAELLRVRLAIAAGEALQPQLAELGRFCLDWGSQPAQATLAATWAQALLQGGAAVTGQKLARAALRCPDLDAGERAFLARLLGLPATPPPPRKGPAASSLLLQCLAAPP